MDGDDSDAVAVVKHVDAWVALEWLEAPGVKLGVDCVVPLVWCLFKAVEGLVEFANVIGLCQVNIAFRLVDVDLFGEIHV